MTLFTSMYPVCGFTERITNAEGTVYNGERDREREN